MPRDRRHILIVVVGDAPYVLGHSLGSCRGGHIGTHVSHIVVCYVRLAFNTVFGLANFHEEAEGVWCDLLWEQWHLRNYYLVSPPYCHLNASILFSHSRPLGRHHRSYIDRLRVALIHAFAGSRKEHIGEHADK